MQPLPLSSERLPLREFVIAPASLLLFALCGTISGLFEASPSCERQLWTYEQSMHRGLEAVNNTEQNVR